MTGVARMARTIGGEASVSHLPRVHPDVAPGTAGSWLGRKLDPARAHVVLINPPSIT